MPKLVIEVRQLCTELDERSIHKDLDLSVAQGEILAIVGESGSGKTTLLNCLLMLATPKKGTIKILDYDVTHISQAARAYLRTQCGILFQSGGLFSELTVLENICFPMTQHSAIDPAMQTQLGLLKLAMAGLKEEDAGKYPDALSGGMMKRAAMARSIALDPAILFLDEPSAGLDPINASSLDQLILNLRAALQLTVVMVTHDLDSLAAVSDRIAFIGQGRVLVCDTLANLLKSNIPEVKAYFQNARAKRTFAKGAF